MNIIGDLLKVGDFSIVLTFKMLHRRDLIAGFYSKLSQVLSTTFLEGDYPLLALGPDRCQPVLKRLDSTLLVPRLSQLSSTSSLCIPPVHNKQHVGHIFGFRNNFKLHIDAFVMPISVMR